MLSANHMLSISTYTSHSSPSELCSNWWPSTNLAIAHVPGMPHPLCHMCANWLPDIEDMGISLIDCQTKRLSSCGNNWPQERNVIKPLLPTPVLKDETLAVVTLHSSILRTGK
jgi:hypothetical protein